MKTVEETLDYAVGELYLPDLRSLLAIETDDHQGECGALMVTLIMQAMDFLGSLFHPWDIRGDDAYWAAVFIVANPRYARVPAFEIRDAVWFGCLPSPRWRIGKGDSSEERTYHIAQSPDGTKYINARVLFEDFERSYKLFRAWLRDDKAISVAGESVTLEAMQERLKEMVGEAA